MQKLFTLFLIALRRSRTEPPLYDLNFRRSAKEINRFVFVLMLAVLAAGFKRNLCLLGVSHSIYSYMT